MRFRDRGWIAAWLCALSLLAWYALTCSVGRTTHGFIAYYAAARLLRSGGFGAQVYDDDWFVAYVQELTASGVLEIFGPNPPSMALMAVPVAWLPPSSARTVWLAVSIALFAAAVLALTRTISRPALRLACVPLLMATPAVMANVRTGQAYLLLFAALTVIVLSVRRNLDRIGGGLLGAVLLVKTSGAALALALAARGRRVAAVHLAGAAAVLFVIALAGTGVEAWRRYPVYVLEFIARPASSATAYQTTYGLFHRLCVADAAWNPAPPLSCAGVATAAPAAIVAAAMLVTLWVVRRSSLDRALAGGTALSVLSLPIAEDTHFVLLGIPLVLMLQSASAQCWRWLVPFAALMLVPAELTIERFTSGWLIPLAYPRLHAGWLLWAIAMRETAGAAPVDSPAPGTRANMPRTCSPRV